MFGNTHNLGCLHRASISMSLGGLDNLATYLETLKAHELSRNPMHTLNIQNPLFYGDKHQSLNSTLEEPEQRGILSSQSK